MKTRIKNSFLMPALIAGLGLLPAGRVTAKTFTTLHSFTALTPYHTNSDGVFDNNTDGAFPTDGVVLSEKHRMRRRALVAVRTLARSSPSTPLARRLRPCILSLAATD